MLVTHGGNCRLFEWQLNGNIIDICNENDKRHSYKLPEIYEIIKWIEDNVDKNWFPLGNNVALMGRGEEIKGLGVAILNLTPKNITHAQGSSYLGVVLEEIGIFEWNGAKKGIKWRIIKKVNTLTKLINIFSKHKKYSANLLEPTFNVVGVKSEESLVKLTNDVKSIINETIVIVQYPTCLRCKNGINDWKLKYQEIDKLNKKILGEVSNRNGIYAIYSMGNSNHWKIQYIGETKSNISRQRIRSHIIWRNKETKSGKITGSQFDEVQKIIMLGQTIGLSFVEIHPGSLRHYVEENLIKSLQPPWNLHGNATK